MEAGSRHGRQTLPSGEGGPSAAGICHGRPCPRMSASMSMSCPRCQVLLCEVTSAGVVADACGTCRGMWLDRGE
ncbi:MAG: hypothetical protein EHM89_19825, partial [Acidobacteria bacterium]